MGSTAILERFQLEGKVALVTGCTRGIGLAMSEALAQAGADIIGVSASLQPGPEPPRPEEPGQRLVPSRPKPDAPAVDQEVERGQDGRPDVLPLRPGLELHGVPVLDRRGPAVAEGHDATNDRGQDTAAGGAPMLATRTAVAQILEE